MPLKTEEKTILKPINYPTQQINLQTKKGSVYWYIADYMQ